MAFDSEHNTDRDGSAAEVTAIGLALAAGVVVCGLLTGAVLYGLAWLLILVAS